MHRNCELSRRQLLAIDVQRGRKGDIATLALSKGGVEQCWSMLACACIERLLIQLRLCGTCIHGALHIEPRERARVGRKTELVVYTFGELELSHGVIAGERVSAEEITLQLTLVPATVATVRERPALRAVQVVADRILAQLNDVGDTGDRKSVLREV